MMKKLLIGLVLALGLSAAHAQAPVQQTPTRLDAAQLVATSNTSAATITLTPPSGQYVYVTGVEITNCIGGTAATAATPTSVTTTNLGGATWQVGSGVTAGLCQPSPSAGTFGLPLKSAAPGTNVTIVLPTFVTNQTIRVSVYYYFAP